MKKEKLINKNNTIISKNVSEALNVKKTISSGNIMFVGEQDLTSLIITNILQLNSSFVVTVSNEGIVSSDIEKFLKSNGYNVKILDLRPNHESSECYNPLKRIKNEDDMCKFVDCIMMNSSSNDAKEYDKDDFWIPAERCLLIAALAYVLKYNKEDKKNIMELFEFFASDGYAYCENNDGIIHMFELFEKCPHDSLTYKYYAAFDKSSGKSKKGMFVSALLRLHKFYYTNHNTLNRDTLNIEIMEKEKTALFIIPAQDNYCNELYSILYTQIIDTLFEFEDKNRGSELIPVQLFMNNFAANGRIPEFETKLVMMCNYNVSARIFVESITQLKQKYPNTWNELMCNCSHSVFLGASNFETLLYFAEKIDEIKSECIRGTSLLNIMEELNKLSEHKCVVIREYSCKKEIILDNKYYPNHHPLLTGSGWFVL